MTWVELFLIFSLVEFILARNSPRVTTPLGIIEGTVEKTYTGKLFFQFEGIPYAAPPIGELRYEDPQDPQKWKGILKAAIRPVCTQYDQFQQKEDGSFRTIGEEDCLYYNVYTPTLNRSVNLDVLIHIHGGAFMYGAGSSWRPHVLLNRPIIFVSLNYRLGPLGFLSTEDDVLPGNLGLKDQQKALKWIKRNIKYFGGNPNSITLHGLSAGGASVQLHSLLPGSRGLFHRAVAESGTAFDSWVLMENPLEHARSLGSFVGCPTTSSRKLKKCLKRLPAKEIVQNVSNFQVFLYNPFSPWAVVVDGQWASKPVLPDHPLNLLRQKKIYDVPLLMSFTTSEGLYPAAWFYEKDEYLELIDTNWNQLMPHIMMYNYTVDHSIIDWVSQTIRKEYLGTAPLDKCSFSRLVQAVGDRLFVGSKEKALKLHSAGVKSPVWSYMYNYRANTSLSVFAAKTTKDLGVAHSDNAILIMGSTPPATPADIAVAELLVDMLTLFMDTGAPNISTVWEPISKNVHDALNLLKINSHNDLRPLQEEHIGRRPFWDSLPFNENERLLNITLGF